MKPAAARPGTPAGPRLLMGAVTVALVLAAVVVPGHAPVVASATDAATVAGASAPGAGLPTAVAGTERHTAGTERRTAVAGTGRPTEPRRGVVAAAGVRQYLQCSGTGPVTIVVVPGLGAAASSWSGVAGSLARISRTCRYDRPGLGASPPRPRAGQVVDAGLYARELAALLVAAREPGPYVVVGHSFGGLVAQAFAHDFPTAVAGLLLAESVDARDPRTSAYWHEAGHAVDMVRSRSSARGTLLGGSGPLLVLSASNPDRDHLGGPAYGQGAAVTARWRASQRAMTRLSSDSLQITARSGHVVQQDDPAATVAAVRVLTHAVVTDVPLRCTGTWTQLHATCRPGRTG